MAALLVLAGCYKGGGAHAWPVQGGEPHSWVGAVSDKPLALRVFIPPNVTTKSPLSVVFYLQNLAAPRVGTERDASILQDFREAGYLVVAVDYAKSTNARIPFINRDLGKLRDDVRAKKLLGEFNVDMAHVFIRAGGLSFEARRGVLSRRRADIGDGYHLSVEAEASGGRGD